MVLKSSLIFLLLMTACSPEPTVELIPESPKIYRECDKLCRKKYGEDVSVFTVQKIPGTDEFTCYCK
jgi:hypothetical protein